jgi:hypothetical protein
VFIGCESENDILQAAVVIVCIERLSDGHYHLY